MKTILFSALLLAFALPSLSTAELDLDKEVLVIPDTHNEKPYIWRVERNPRGYELVLSGNGDRAGEDKTYAFRIISPPDVPVGEVHVFITDPDLHVYAHEKAVRSGADYRITFKAPAAGTYRLEAVFETPKGWIDLRKDIKITSAQGAADKLPGDDDYQVKVKLVPKKAYAEHVVTFIYQISYKGAPLTDIDRLDGFDMQVGAWDAELKEFIYATPKQNLGGPEVAVSIVFMRPGLHAVFAEFKHKGVVRRIDSVVFVNKEFLHEPGAIENLKPGG